MSAVKPAILKSDDRLFLRLLALAPFDRRPGGWRFGTRRVDDAVVARLIGSGRATSDGAQVFLARLPK